MDEAKLITLVQINNHLYNKANPDFKNPTKKKEAWISIAEEMGSSSEICERRWVSLRERFCKALRQMEGSSGSGVSDGDKWIFFDSMLFVKDHLLKRKQRTNQSMQSEPMSPEFQTISPAPATVVSIPTSPLSILPVYELSEPLPVQLSPALSQTSEAPSRPKKSKETDMTQLLTDVSANFNKYVESVKTKQVDGTVSGFTTIATTSLSAMKPKRKMGTIMKLMQVLQEAELESDDE